MPQVHISMEIPSARPTNLNLNRRGLGTVTSVPPNNDQEQSLARACLIFCLTYCWKRLCLLYDHVAQSDIFYITRQSYRNLKRYMDNISMVESGGLSTRSTV